MSLLVPSSSSWRLPRGCLHLFLVGVALTTVAGGGTGSLRPKDTLRVAYFSKDVPSIDPLSPSFDPDSYAVIAQIFDSLVYLDLEGEVCKGLAESWEQLSEKKWEFRLRPGVVFHNGEVCDARAVKFTYDYVLDPSHRAGNAWILGIIDEVICDSRDPLRVVITTRHEDGMFLNRLSMFGSICPPEYCRRVGMEEFARRPVGTGPYQLFDRKENEFIELRRNPRYWDPEIPKIEKLRFEILPEREWLEAFLSNRVDFLPNLAGNQTSRLKREAKGEVKFIKRLVLSGYWVLVRNSGVLADRRVRRALNHAVDKEALVRYGDFGNAAPLASLGKEGEYGAHPDLTPYEYSPERALALLDEASVKRPVELRAIVADIALPVAKIIRANFRRIGVNLDLEVVSRSEWSRKVVNYKIEHGSPPNYDLAINLVDNPIYDLTFHAGVFLHSDSPWSLTQHEVYDEKFLNAARSSGEDHRRRLEELDKFIHDEALMVFTTQRIITAAVKPGLTIPGFSKSGHLDYLVLTQAEFDGTGK